MNVSLRIIAFVMLFNPVTACGGEHRTLVGGTGSSHRGGHYVRTWGGGSGGIGSDIGDDDDGTAAVVAIVIVLVILAVLVIHLYTLQNQEPGAFNQAFVKSSYLDVRISDADRRTHEDAIRRREASRMEQVRKDRERQQLERQTRNQQRQKWRKENEAILVGAGLPAVVIVLTISLIAAIHFATQRPIAAPQSQTQATSR